MKTILALALLLARVRAQDPGEDESLKLLPPEIQAKVKGLKQKALTLAENYGKQGLPPDQIQKKVEAELKKDLEEIQALIQKAGLGGANPKEAEKVPEEIDLPLLLPYLRGGAGSAQDLAMERFAGRADAPKQIPELLKILKEEAPRLDNNLCLLLERILRKHPEAECPLDPLLEVIGRRIWTSQQKGSQALAEALKPSRWKGKEEPLYRALIPLLTSQRWRVYVGALRCLQKFSGEKFGPDPEAWKAHYEKLYPGKTIDLAGAVYERLVVIQPLGEKPPMAYRVDGEQAADADALLAKVTEAKKAAARSNLQLGAVIQISNQAMMQQRPGHSELVQEAIRCLQSAAINEYTISPQVDVFRPPYSPREGR